MNKTDEVHAYTGSCFAHEIDAQEELALPTQLVHALGAMSCRNGPNGL